MKKVNLTLVSVMEAKLVAIVQMDVIQMEKLIIAGNKPLIK